MKSGKFNWRCRGRLGYHDREISPARAVEGAVFPTWCKCLAVLLAVALPPGGQGEKPPPPKAVERDGLAVTIRPLKAAFAPGEALEFEVTFKNVSDEPIRLPDRPRNYNTWEFHLARAGYKKGFIGRNILPAGKPAKAAPTAALKPGETMSVNVRLDGAYAFAVGAWDAKKAFRQLPEGRYRLRAEIKFASPPRSDKDPARVWAGDPPLLTRPAEFVVESPDS
jgi:hypothetical protein